MNTRSKRSRQEAARRNQRRKAAIQQRSAAHRASVQAAIDARRHRRRRRIQWIAGSVAVAALVGAGAFVFAGRDDDTASGGGEPELTAGLVEQATGALAIGEVPDAYSITYHVQRWSDGEPSADASQTFDVRRPFESRITYSPIFDEVPTDAQSTPAYTVTGALGVYSNRTGDQAEHAEAVVPGLALADFRFDTALGDLLDEGTFVLRERRTLLGRECQVYRTGRPVLDFTVSAPTETSFTDLCLDASGLMLEEVSVADGEVTERMVATAVDTGATFTDDTFAIGATPPSLADGGAELAELDTETAPIDDYWTVSDVPEGYRLTGRYSYTVPGEGSAATTPTTDPLTGDTVVDETPPIVSYADVYTNGSDVVVVRQGPVAVEPDTTDATTVEDSPGLSEVSSSAALTGNTVVAHPAAPDGWFVSITGSASLDDLLGWLGVLTDAS